MKQVVISIPDNKYRAFISHLKSQFADIQIIEKKSKAEESLIGEDDSYEAMLLSESSLAEDWLSDEDNRWDKVL